MAATMDFNGIKLTPEQYAVVLKAVADAKAKPAATISFKVNATNVEFDRKDKKGVAFREFGKGGISAYGFGQYPITMYPKAWQALLACKEQILELIESNKDVLSWDKADKDKAKAKAETPAAPIDMDALAAALKAIAQAKAS